VPCVFDVTRAVFEEAGQFADGGRVDGSRGLTIPGTRRILLPVAIRQAFERGVVKRLGWIFTLAGLGLIVLAFSIPGQAGLLAIDCAAVAEVLGVILVSASEWVLRRRFPWANLLYLAFILFILAILGPVVAAAGPAIGPVSH